jgi:hypothetical protein
MHDLIALCIPINLPLCVYACACMCDLCEYMCVCVCVLPALAQTVLCVPFNPALPLLFLHLHPSQRAHPA